MSSQKKSQKHKRYVNIFNDMGADWEAIVNERDTEKEAGFVERVITKKGMTLDLCCGTARHSINIHQKGRNIVGMDLSKNLLAIAKTRMRQVRAKFPLIRADMRYFPFKDGVFSAIINMFTSFGYLPSESEDNECLLEINRTLKKSGTFLLDISNRDHIVKNFRERDWAEFEPFFLLEKRSLDLKDSKLMSDWTLLKKRSRQVRLIRHEVRLYTFARIQQLLNEAGLTVKAVYGGYERQEFSLEASRMIVLAQKG